MYRQSLPILLLLSLSSAAIAIDASSRIDAVALYPSGAIVTRVASVTLPAGTSTVRFTGLVNGLDPERIQLRAVAGDVEVGQVRIASEQQRDAFNAEIERLNAEIRTAEQRIVVIDDAVKSAELRLKFLDGLAQGYSKEAWYGSAQGAADINSWRQALALLESASSDAYAEIRKQKASRPDAERDLSVLQRELITMRGGTLSSTVLEVSLRAERAVSTELRLEYFQNGATWSPQYEARLDSDAGRLRLVQQASVEQHTDEAWNNISLSLSTSDPSGELSPGDLRPEFLDLYDPPAAAPALSQILASGVTADAMEKLAVTANREVTARVGNYAVTYEIPGRVSVANGSDEKQFFDVSSFDAEVNLVTRVIPRKGERAYLAARFV
ncbi:MAG: mucoidy inhibitor MuiA family protein, partial [Halioglobus sp.]|nr:mucoidy inhibitor MuiA family protein [Halioglobus sp.]